MKTTEIESVRKEYKVHEFLRKLWPYYKKYFWRTVFVLSALGIYTLAARVLPFIFGQAIDLGFKQDDANLIFKFALYYLAFEVIRSTFYFLQFYFSQKLSNRILFDIRSKLFDHVQKLPISFYDKNSTGKILTRITNDVTGLGDFLTQGFTGILVSLVEITSIFIALMVLSWKMSLVAFAMTPAIVWASVILSHQVRKHSRNAKAQMSKINSHSAESISGMKVINLYNHKDKTYQNFSDLTEKYFYIVYDWVKSYALLWPSLHAFTITVTISSLSVGALFYNSLGLTIGNLTAYIILLQTFYRPMRTILERYSQFQNSLASADRIFDLLSEPQEVSPSFSPNQEFKGHIQFKNLNFKYNPDTPLVLDGLSLDIPAGESLAVIGRTGSGKSTLVSLLQKFYAVADNQLYIDDHCINKLSLPYLRAHIKILQQNPFLFKGSLEDNITLFSPHVSEEKAREALSLVQCDHLVKRQESAKNKNEFISEGGENLSQGEKQLICFARILAHDPKVLILDEATANIDSKNEALIQKSLEKLMKNRTCIIIAHRLSTIENCDRILVLNQGKVEEIGSHSELLEKNGAYAKLQYKQRSAAKPKTI